MSKKIADVKKEFLESSIDQYQDLIAMYQCDERPGVIQLVKKYEKQLDGIRLERIRLEVMKEFERKYADYDLICGIDEVGRGPLAGPVIAGAVILPKDTEILYLNDSKQLSEKKREALYDEIMSKAVAAATGSASHETIDSINILQATYEAMRKAIGNLLVAPNLLLNDAVHIPEVSIKQISIVKGDAKSVSIAAASIIAKVTRDRLMVQYDEVFPGYGFASNKGYGSASHIKALKEIGPSPIHRMTFIKNFL